MVKQPSSLPSPVYTSFPYLGIQSGGPPSPPPPQRFLTILHMRVVRRAHSTIFDFSIPKIFCDQCNYEPLLVFSSRSVLRFLKY